MTAHGAPPEQAFAFALEGDTLLGILHPPAAACASGTGVLVVVGGPQYRAGSHRQFVALARRLATEGHAVLRFDARGMGDSSGALRSFEHISADIGAALAQLRLRQPQLQRIVLWGLCDGASAALLHLHAHPETTVHGMCLLNPWVRSETSLARTEIRHYYRQRLLQRSFWAKLLRGQIAGAALRGLWRSLRAASAGAEGTAGQPSAAESAADERGARSAKGGKGGKGAEGAELAGKAREAGSSATANTAPVGSTLPYQQRMALAWAGWTDRQRPLLLVLSGHDYTAREFEDTVAADPHWRGALQRPSVQRHDATGADHTFSAPNESDALEALTLEWLRALPQAVAT